MKETMLSFVSRVACLRVLYAAIIGYSIGHWLSSLVFFGFIAQLGVRLFWPEGRFFVHDRVYSVLDYMVSLLRYALFLQDDLPYPLNQLPQSRG